MAENSFEQFLSDAMRYLEDELDLPPEYAERNAKNRFRFQSATFKMIYRQARENRKMAENNRRQLIAQWVIMAVILMLLATHVDLPLLSLLP